jgi:hypothetical protein
MKRQISAVLFLAVLLSACGAASAEQWNPVPGWPLWYYDAESIQYPEKIYTSWGLFVVARDNLDLVRVWTKLAAPEGENPRTLYEMRFSQRSCRAVYSVDQRENQVPPLDTSYAPVVPDTMLDSLLKTLHKVSREEDTTYIIEP